MDSPLRGQRVLVLRPAEQAGALVDLLAAAGAEPIAVAAVEIAPLEDTAVLDDAIARSHTFGWMVFTSVNGARIAIDRARATDTKFDPQRVAAIGPATADALRDAGVDVSWAPSTYTTKALAAEFPGPPVAVCLLRAQGADSGLDDALRERGFAVTRVDAYATRAINAAAIHEQMERGIDAVLLTSASIARSFATAAGDLAGDTLVCCIGPATAKAARGSGLTVGIEATEHTTAGLVETLAKTVRAGS